MASISDLWHDPHQDVQHRTQVLACRPGRSSRSCTRTSCASSRSRSSRRQRTFRCAFTFFRFLGYPEAHGRYRCECLCIAPCDPSACVLMTSGYTQLSRCLHNSLCTYTLRFRTCSSRAMTFARLVAILDGTPIDSTAPFEGDEPPLSQRNLLSRTPTPRSELKSNV